MSEKDIRCSFCGRRKAGKDKDVVFISPQSLDVAICAYCVVSEKRKLDFEQELKRR